MSTANERQHGGNHYKGTDYQHWDWVTDTKLHYLLGCASKYVYRRKGEDRVTELQKALHYLDKATENNVQGSITTGREAMFWKFVLNNDVKLYDAAALYFIMEGKLGQAASTIGTMLEELKSSA